LKRQSERFIKNTFKKSTKLYNVAAIVCFMAALWGVPLSLVFLEATGWELFRCSGLVSLFTAVTAGLTAFLGQSVNQSLRGWAYANGTGWGVFGQEESVIPKSILGHFAFVGSWHSFHVDNANINNSATITPTAMPARTAGLPTRRLPGHLTLLGEPKRQRLRQP
jgi:hypothetical protein